jgi:uncharacterized Ntn-hydrolase superfamily protein
MVAGESPERAVGRIGMCNTGNGVTHGATCATTAVVIIGTSGIAGGTDSTAGTVDHGGAASCREAAPVDPAALGAVQRRGSMDPFPAEFAATYSIVARDPASGEMGVAVQSNNFSVGTVVSWAEPGVGAVATQSIVEVSYGPKGLELLAKGLAADEALKMLVQQDSGAPLRQVGMVDVHGRVAAHTGQACVPACGHVFGAGYSVQGNMLASDSVWKAMGPAFEAAEGDLADRLMAALEAAETAGGDVRGRQSAALLVVAGERPQNAWEGRRIDLHVEDDPRPLDELRRLLTIRRAHDLFEEGRAMVGSGDIDGALAKVVRARELQPDNVQFSFWAGVALANAGRDAEARVWFDEAFAVSPVWRELGRRLCIVGIYSGDPALLES